VSETAIGADAPAARSTDRALGITYATSLAVSGGASLMYPLLAVIALDLAVSEEEIGLAMAAFFMPAIVLAPVFGMLADLRGRRRVLIFGLTLFGIAGAGAGLAPSFDWVLAMRAVQGIGMSALSPLTIVLISDLLPAEKELHGQGMKVVFDRLGMILLPVIGGGLAILSWRLSLSLFALTVPLAAAAYLWMPETRAPGSQDLRNYLRNTLLAAKRPRLHLAFAAGFLRFFLDTGLYTYLPILLAFRYHSSPATVGWMVAASAVGSITTAMNAGRLKRFKPERMLSAAFAASAAAMAPAALDAPLWLLFAAMVVFGLANGVISPLQKSLLTQRTEPNLRGAVVSVDRVIQQIGKSIAPVLMGLLLITAPIEWVFWALCLAGTAGAIILLGAEFRSGLSSPRRRRDPEETGSQTGSRS